MSRCVECDNPKPHAPHMPSPSILNRVSRAALQKKAAGHELTDAIRDAVTAGHSQAEVARAAGLTRARVHQIVKAAAATIGVALILAATASGATVTPSAILSHVAGRPVTALCVPTGHGMNYTDWNARKSGPGNQARIGRLYCQQITRMIQQRTRWQAGYDQQVALVSLIHEGIHLRGGPHWLDESWVQCKALHELPKVAAWLGVQLQDARFNARWIWRHSPPEYQATTCTL